MDPLTHAASGLVAGQWLKSRYQSSNRWLLPLCVGLTTLPDLDIVLQSDPETAILYRRSLTHSFLGLSFLAVLVFPIAKKVFPATLTKYQVFFFCLSLLSLHSFFDLVNSYGTQILFPLNSDRIAWDLIFIIDPFWTLALLICGILPWIWKAQAKRIALKGVALCFAYPLVCYLSRTTAERVIAQQIPAPFTVLPDAFSPWYWKVIEDRSTEYRLHSFHWADRNLKEVSTYQKLSEEDFDRLETPHRFLKTYEWFNRFPVLSKREENSSGELQLFIEDLRFLSIHEFMKARTSSEGTGPFGAILTFSPGAERPSQAQFEGTKYVLIPKESSDSP